MFIFKELIPSAFKKVLKKIIANVILILILSKYKCEFPFSSEMKKKCFPRKILTWTDTDKFLLELFIIAMFHHFKLHQVYILIMDGEEDYTFLKLNDGYVAQ